MDYIFIDEAHKISEEDSRSAFYYSVIERLCERQRKPRIIFASPNIPNPEIYQQLIPETADVVKNQMASEYTPVSQVKFLVDFNHQEVKYYDSIKRCLKYATELTGDENLYKLLRRLGKGSKNLVYCHSKTRVIEYAQTYANMLPELHDPDLDALSDEIKDEVYSDYFLAETVKRGVAYHMGYLPAALRLRIEELFRQDGKIHTIVCTSTLLEGVNLPADNLFVTHYLNGKKELNEVAFRNLLGRVGRIQYNLYGNVYLMALEKDADTQKYADMLRLKEKTLIIDAKYYGQTLQKQFDKYSLHSGNVYQIFTYVKNQDKDNTGNVAGILLYAKTDEDITPDCMFNMGGNQIGAKTLDLNKDFSLIAAQLDKIAEDYFGKQKK